MRFIYRSHICYPEKLRCKKCFVFSFKNRYKGIREVLVSTLRCSLDHQYSMPEQTLISELKVNMVFLESNIQATNGLVEDWLPKIPDMQRSSFKQIHKFRVFKQGKPGLPICKCLPQSGSFQIFLTSLLLQPFWTQPQIT